MLLFKIGFALGIALSVWAYRLAVYKVPRRTQRSFGWLIPLSMLFCTWGVANLLYATGHSLMSSHIVFRVTFSVALYALWGVTIIAMLRAARRDRRRQEEQEKRRAFRPGR